MTTTTDVVNLGLQYLGTRTTVTAAELAAGSSNEAVQANLILTRTRDRLLRMAPWNCGMRTAQLVYITSIPGTPENSSPSASLWAPGIPAPPWAYEYQYPVDCMRPCFVLPGEFSSGFPGVPITTAVTGFAPANWIGKPISYRVATDQFFPVTSATVAAGGAGFAIGDTVTLFDIYDSPAGQVPFGAPPVLTVTGVAAGAITTVTVNNQIPNASPAAGGSYFNPLSNPVIMGSTSAGGSGASFNLSYLPKSDQRVILTNQEKALLSYIKQVTDPNIMDELFIDAWAAILGAQLCMSLTGDKDIAKAMANVAVKDGNGKIAEARKADANEGLTVVNVTPDWIRARGYNQDSLSNAWMGVDWGDLWPMYT